MTAPEPAHDGNKANPANVRRDFYRLALDWVYLKTNLPTPPRKETIRRTTTREYGHPASWASDTSAEIASIFHDWHDLIAEQRKETPPPPTTTAETVRVVTAWRYLEPRFEQLCDLVTKDDLTEITELHHKIRHTLLLDRQPAVWLSIECPICDHKSIFRNIQNERLTCGNCGWSDTEEHKEFHVFRTLVNVVERHEAFLP